MAHAYHHSLSSVKRFGGAAEDYYQIHAWFDQTKAHMADARHRALLHSSFGIFLAEQVFGPTLEISTGKQVPVRAIGEQHVMEDMGGRIPSVQDWLGEMPIQPWMFQGAAALSRDKKLREQEGGSDVEG